jgi:hypothetical protein
VPADGDRQLFLIRTLDPRPGPTLPRQRGPRLLRPEDGHVAEAVLTALTADIDGHHRLTLCWPEDFDTSAAFETLGLRARKGRSN